jgi:uncharacterized iron-regulated membrane protein
MKVRRLVFWLHLIVGVSIGLVVAFLAITGSILAFQSQFISWAERDARIGSLPTAGTCVLPSELLANASADQAHSPSSLTLYADPHRPAEVAFGRTTLLANGCTGQVIRRDAGRLRAFFSDIKDLHRWVAWGGVRHENLRAFKDAANLCFLFLLLSGAYLWIPRKLAWQNFKSGTMLRGRLKGRARDWSLHNVIGFWMVIPLVVIVSSGVIMAYPWANGLLYQAAGTPLQPGATEPSPKQSKPLNVEKYPVLDAAIQTAMTQNPHWQSLQMRMPGEKDGPIAFTLDEGNGGNPLQRTQLAVARKDARVTRWEPFSANPRGRQWRLYARFLHTGEIFGLVGQAVALFATLGALVLVWTGFALAIRRLAAWRSRTRKHSKDSRTRFEIYS